MFKKSPGKQNSNSPQLPQTTITTTSNSNSKNEYNELEPLRPEVESVMSEIYKTWDFMTAENFNPVPLALDLIDTSAGSKKLEDFQQMLEKLEKAMEFIVNDHYQAFNNSIETFTSVTEKIADSRRKIQELGENLKNSKTLLQCKRPDLLDMWSKSMQYKEMIKMLDTIEDLRKTPEKVEKLVQQKYYLTAVKTLLVSLKTLESPDFDQVKALTDIKSSLISLKLSLHETIIHQLHQYLYLKSPHCDDRFLESITGDTFNDIKSQNKFWKYSSTDASKTSVTTSYESNRVTEDLDDNAETNVFKFIEVMLTALEMLGKMTEAANVLKQRLPFELYQVTESVLTKTEIRWKENIQFSSSIDKKTNLYGKLSLLRSNVQAPILKDLLSRLFTRFLQVSEMHRFTIEAFKRVMQRSQASYPSSATKIDTKLVRYTIIDLWNSMQTEVTTIIYSFVSELQKSIPSSTLDVDTNKNMEQRGLFRFSDSEMGKGDIDKTFGGKENLVGVVDNLIPASQRVGRRVLVKPSIFNLTITFKQVFDFIDIMERSFLTRSERRCDIFTFMEGLLLKHFIPQIEDIVIQRFYDSVNSLDSFKPIKSNSYALPVMRVSLVTKFYLYQAMLSIVDILKEFSATVYKVPIHQAKLVLIVETLLTKFQEKVATRVSAVSCDHEKEDGSKNHVDTSEHAVSHSKTVIPDEYFNDTFRFKEIVIEWQSRHQKSSHRAEIMFEIPELEFLASMRTSLIYFTHALESIQKLSSNKDATIGLRPFSEVTGQSDDFLRHDLFLQDSEESTEISEQFLKEAACLFLDESTKKRFDDISRGFAKLSDKCLDILKREINCNC